MTLAGFAETPEPPYYAVIFTSKLKATDSGYASMLEAMLKIAVEQPGFISREAVRGPDGFGIHVIYYKDEAAILAWRQHERHAAAQKIGKERWYEHYEMRVAKVERAYSGPEGRS